MPGTILASVLELSELPAVPPTAGVDGGGDPFHLSVSLGRREFRTYDGVGDFSFPVSSLRDDLILTLCDAEGNQISRAVIRTVQVMEKGFWDSWFPLKGGGNVHMILQFSLNEDERKRIFEKRESVVKSQFTNLITSGRRHSFSEEILRPSNPKASIELQKESHLTSYLLQNAPEANTTQVVSLHPQEPQKHPFSDSDQAKLLIELSPTNAYGFRGPLGEGSNPNFAEMAATVSGLTTQDSTILLPVKDDEVAIKKQNDVKSHSASVKNIINAFETNLTQENTPRSHMESLKGFRLRKNESTGSLKEATYNKGQLGNGITSFEVTSVVKNSTKSVSSVMILEMDQEKTSEFLNPLIGNKIEDQTEFITYFNPETSITTRSSMDLCTPAQIEPGATTHSIQDARSCIVVEALQSPLVVNSRELDESCEYGSSTGDAKPSVGVIHEMIHESFIEEPLEREEPENFIHSSPDIVPCSIPLALSDSACGNHDARGEPPEYPATEVVDGNVKSNGSSTLEQTACSPDRSMRAHMSPITELVVSTILQTSQEIGSSSTSTSKEQNFVSSASRSNNLIENYAGTSSVKLLEMSTDMCLIWYPNFWKRRHCITTASRQLIDNLEGYDILWDTYPKPVADLSVPKEPTKHGSLIDNTFRENDTPCISKQSNSRCIFPKLYISREFIERGLKVIILVMACGTLILNAGAT